MNITRTNLPKSIIELLIEESSENIAKFRKNVISDLKKNGREIKGFRKWALVPENIIVRNYWEDYILQLTVEYAIDSLYKEAIYKEWIIPVSQAKITEVRTQSPLVFVVHVETLPVLEIDKEYRKIKFKKGVSTVSNSEVENALDDIKTRFTKFEESKDLNTNIEFGDRVTINTDGYDLEWKFLDSTSMREYPLVIWSKILVPWFEEWLIWSKLWDELSLDITFPEDYHNKAFAWKKTLFKVKIIKIEKSVKPEFTPEFIEQLRWKKLNLEQFRELIKSELLDVKDSNLRIDEETKLIEELLKFTKIDIWDGLIENKIEQVFSEIKENIVKDWYKVSDYIDSLNLTEEQYKEKNVKPIALKRLEWELILHKLMELENTKVEDEQVEKEINTILWRFDSEDVLKRLRELYVSWTKYYEELKQRIAYRNLIDSFFE